MAGWIHGLVKTLKKRCGYYEDMDPFRKGMMPLMLVYKVVGRFPYQINENGRMEVMYRSLPGLYFLTVYGILTAVAVDYVTGDNLMGYFSMEDFFMTIKGTSAIISLFLHFGVTLTLLRGWDDLAMYFNKWSGFCVHYEKTMGVPFKFGLRNGVVAWSIAIVAFSPIVVLNLTTILYNRHAYHLLVSGADVVAAMVEYSFFGICCYQLIGVASSIDARLRQITARGRISALELSDIRRLWVEVSHLAQNTGSSMMVQLFFELGGSTAIISVAAFGMISSLIAGDFHIMQYVFCIGIVGLRLFFFFEMGERLTYAAGNKISNTVSILSVTLMGDDAADEYEMLIQSINANFPVVTVGGLANISRRALGSVLSATTLYILVMIQMQVGSLTN